MVERDIIYCERDKLPSEHDKANHERDKPTSEHNKLSRSKAFACLEISKSLSEFTYLKDGIIVGCSEKPSGHLIEPL